MKTAVYQHQTETNAGVLMYLNKLLGQLETDLNNGHKNYDWERYKRMGFNVDKNWMYTIRVNDFECRLPIRPEEVVFDNSGTPIHFDYLKAIIKEFKALKVTDTPELCKYKLTPLKELTYQQKIDRIHTFGDENTTTTMLEVANDNALSLNAIPNPNKKIVEMVSNQLREAKLIFDTCKGWNWTNILDNRAKEKLKQQLEDTDQFMDNLNEFRKHVGYTPETLTFNNMIAEYGLSAIVPIDKGILEHIGIIENYTRYSNTEISTVQSLVALLEDKIADKINKLNEFHKKDGTLKKLSRRQTSDYYHYKGQRDDLRRDLDTIEKNKHQLQTLLNSKNAKFITA